MDKEAAWNAVAGFLTGLALEQGLADNTCQAYRRDLADVIEYCDREGVVDWQSVQPAHLSGYLEQLFDLGVAAATVNRRLSAIRHFYRHLQREGLVKANPAVLMQSTKKRRSLPEVLTVTEIETVIASIDRITPNGLRDWAIIEMLYGCGLRVSELTGLRREWFLADGRALNVTGKGNKQRLVPVPGQALHAVNRYLREVRPELAKKSIKARDFVFLSMKQCAPMSRQAVWMLIKHYVAAAGLLVPVTPHTFRHSYATHLLEGGASLRDVQELLGHVSIETTDIYTHIDRSHLIETVRTCHPRR